VTHHFALVPPTGPAPPALEAALQGVAALALLGHFPAATGRRHGLVAGAARPRVARVAARVVTAGQGLAAGVPTAGRRLRAGEVEGGLAAGAAGANSKVRRHTGVQCLQLLDALSADEHRVDDWASADQNGGLGLGWCVCEGEE
jgi:hypothetical protein